MSFNKVVLLGNLGQNAEYKEFKDGEGVLKLRVATSNTYVKADGEKVENTDWHSVSIFGKRAASLAKLQLQKGTQLLVDGSIRYSKYDGKDGETKYSTEIVANDIRLVGKKPTTADTEEAPF